MPTSSWLTVNPNSVEDAISNIMKEYGDVIYKATEEGLAAGEKVLIRNLKAASPSKSGEFKKSWKGTGKKYKLRRFVGNTKTVISQGKKVPLANIFEYSTTNHYKPFVKQTYESSINEIASAIVNEIKKEV